MLAGGIGPPGDPDEALPTRERMACAVGTFCSGETGRVCQSLTGTLTDGKKPETVCSPGRSLDGSSKPFWPGPSSGFILLPTTSIAIVISFVNVPARRFVFSLKPLSFGVRCDPLAQKFIH